MTRLSSEEEDQINQLRFFWDKYGNFILTIFVVIFGGYALFNGYQWYVSKQTEGAAVVFEKIEQAANAKDIALLEKLWETLSSDYQLTTYPDRAALLVAKSYYEGGKTDQAIQVLQWLIQHGDRTEYTNVGRLTLSSLLAEKNDYKQALAVLEGKVSPEFEGLFYDRKGDLAFVQKNYAQAKNFYQQSLDVLKPDSPLKAFVESKLAALPSE